MFVGVLAACMKEQVSGGPHSAPSFNTGGRTPCMPADLHISERVPCQCKEYFFLLFDVYTAFLPMTFSLFDCSFPIGYWIVSRLLL